MPPTPARARRAAARLARPTATARLAGLRRRRGRRGRSSTSTRRAWRRSSACCSSSRGRGTVVVTTPNVEYNVRFETLPAGQLRHRDHRFEWTRAEFRAWADGVAERLRLRRARSRRSAPDDAEVGAADADGGVHADERRSRIPELSPRRARRRVGLGQVDLRRARTSGRPRCCRPTSAAGWSPTTRTTSRRRNDAFEVLHFIAGKRLARGPAHGRRRHQRAAGGAQAAGRAGHASTTCSPVAIVLDLPEEVCHERNAARPDRDFGAARRPQPAPRSCAARCAACSARASATSSSCASREEIDAADGRAPAAVERPPRRPRAVRHHRRRPRLLRRAGRRCSDALG